MKPIIVTVLSARGGVGKSSVAAGIALAHARSGGRCVLVDLDLAARSSDTLLSCGDEVVYDLGDLFLSRRDARGVLLPLTEGAWLIPGAYRCDFTPTEDSLSSILTAVMCECRATLLVLDTPSPAAPVTRMAATLSHLTLAVTAPRPEGHDALSSLACRLSAWGVRDTRLVLNRFSLTQPCDIRAVIDSASLPLCGIVPESEHLTSYLAARGAWDPSHPLSAAFGNMATRLTGGAVPLLDGVSERRREILSV